MNKTLLEIGVPKTCGECMFYRKHRDRCIDHVSCVLGSYDDSNTLYDINYDNSRHHNCAIVKERAMQSLVEYKSKRKQKELLKALQEHSLREFGDITYKSIDDIPNVIDLAYAMIGEEEEHEVQIDFDLKRLQWKEYIDYELKRTKQYTSLDEFINKLKICTFEDIVYEAFYNCTIDRKGIKNVND